MVGCTQLLEDAKEAYAAGMVDLVPELLSSCLENGLSGAAKVEAYKLVINAYLFDYLPDEADKQMSAFLEEFPDYQAQPTDPAEFKLLLESQKEQRAEAAAALAAAERARQEEEAEAIRQAELERQQQLKETSKPLGTSQAAVKTSNVEAPRLGFVVGISGNFGKISESYSVGDPMQEGGSFSLSPGFLFGGKADFPLGKSLDFGIELLYNRVNLNYQASPFTFSSYTFRECENRFQLPLSLAIYLNPYDKTRFYFRVGLVADYMISASAYGTRSYTGTDVFQRDVELEKVSITNTRSRLSLFGLAGLGLSIPLKKAFLYVETRYAGGLFLANLEENRYENQDIIWMLYHVDSNFRVNQVSLNFGMTWNLN